MANITFSEASGLNDSIFGKSQAPIRLFIEKRGEAFEQKSMIPVFCAEEQSQHFGEKYTSMTAMEGFQPVGENGEAPVDGMQEGYSKFIENMTWKNSFSLSREIIEDAKTMDLRRKPEAFVTAYYRTRELFAAALLGAAMTAATSADYGGRKFDATAADNLSFFNTAHLSKVKGGTQCNAFKDAFSDAALAAVETRMQNFCGDNGEVLDISPDTIIIPNIYSLKQAVFAVIGADRDPDSAYNGFNYHFGRWNVAVWPYLNKYVSSGTAPWMLCDSRYNKTAGGFVFQNRTNLDVISYLSQGNDANVWHGYARFTGGFNDWRAYALGGYSSGQTA